MIVNFQEYRLKRQEEQAYRQQLLEQIIYFHQNRPEGDRADSLYFEHIRAHFSIDMLEDIVRRLQQRASNE